MVFFELLEANVGTALGNRTSQTRLLGQLYGGKQAVDLCEWNTGACI